MRWNEKPEHVPGGSRFARLDQVPDAGPGAGAVVEFTPPTFSAQPTQGELITYLTTFSERAREISTRQHRDEQEVVNLKRAVAEFGVAFSEAKTKIEGLTTAMSTGLGGGSNADLIPLSGLGRFVPPEGMAAPHYNLLVSSWNELEFAADYSPPAEFDRAYPMHQGLQTMLRQASGSARMSQLHREFQAASDRVYLVHTMMFHGNEGYRMAVANMGPLQAMKTKLKCWKNYARLEKEFHTAANTGLDTQTSGEGLEWIPTMFSSQLIMAIQAALVIGNLFEHIPMPSPDYKVPVMGADMKSYAMAEGLEEGATKVKAKTFVTRNTTFSAKKFGARILASGEIIEDSIVPIERSIFRDMALAFARGRDDMFWNGDTTAPHMDSDVTESDDVRKKLTGVRKYIRAYAATVPGTTLDAQAAPLNARDTLRQRKWMKAYAQPQRCAYVAGFGSYVEIMLLQDKPGENGRPIFLTRDKYDRPVANTGELGQLAGSPLFMSEFSREDLDSTGVYTGVAGDDDGGMVGYFNRDAFAVGDRRETRMGRFAEIYAESDQIVYVGSERLDFQPWYKQPDERVGTQIVNVK